MDQETEQFIRNLQADRQEAVAKLNQTTNVANSMFAGTNDPNLIEYQLELDNILERIEHLLKGDTLKQDKDGNVFYETPKDEKLRPLSDEGVRYIMNILSFYLNRNTILSNYTDTRINDILYDFGYELNDQMYLNSKMMGLDDEEKQKKYAMIVLEILHTVESAYNRAYRGEERESLRTARVVSQSDNINNNQPYQIPQNKQKTTLNPLTWFK